MSMLSCRVLCLLAIVLCCVGVAHAAVPPGALQYVKEAQEKAKETLKLKAECENAANAAREAADKAQQFVVATESGVETIAADPDKVEKRKSEGHELIDKAMKAAAEARKVANRTTDSKIETENKASLARLSAGETDPEPEEIVEVEKAAEHAESAVRAAGQSADDAEGAAKRVEDVLKKLDAAVVAAAEKKEKQVESQQQTQEKQKEKQKQHYRSTVTINIHGDNLDALLNGAANNSGMALNDGSSSPALLRVPFLLLLLLSVLGCMTVC
ncbi:uncharacterized protein TM35_000081440 [Trypanosoma theileri]|uniref:Surface protein TolT n=1 Tax=Trypanosoma theileri TaxID=67003 RepID=A0A1X0P067_9TRYP|nr:uncharacterized protein TM35_000081440 [Trypanosoma theileri]ORC90346.1 hypothetical protein TM35_000081440 [Trypanosoma theileri]